jgi:lysophospholipase L1-like esterase
MTTSTNNHRAVTFALLSTIVALALPAVAAEPTKEQRGTWIGTWAAAPQPPLPGSLRTFHHQSVRLIVHVSAGGTAVRIRLSNAFGDQPLPIGAAHIARRTAGAEIDPGSDRTLTFAGQPSTTIAPRSNVVSDPVDLNVPALADLAVTLYFPETAAASTLHILAQQTNYISPATADSRDNATAATHFRIDKTIDSWPFLTGVDVLATTPHAATIVAFGSSTTDGDGATKNANQRWPDVLAARLQRDAQDTKDGDVAGVVGVLNEGIIGNRLLHDSPRDSRFGDALGQAGLTRFDRDVLDQPGVKFVFIALGVNDILFPGFPFTPPSEQVTTTDIINSYRSLIARAHAKGIRVIGTTIPPFEGALFKNPDVAFYTPTRDHDRQTVNNWIRTSGAFDGVVDFDKAVQDPTHPTRLLPRYDAGDHLHVNDAGNVASAAAIPLSLFHDR